MQSKINLFNEITFVVDDLLYEFISLTIPWFLTPLAIICVWLTCAAFSDYREARIQSKINKSLPVPVKNYRQVFILMIIVSCIVVVGDIHSIRDIFTQFKGY